MRVPAPRGHREASATRVVAASVVSADAPPLPAPARARRAGRLRPHRCPRSRGPEQLERPPRPQRRPGSSWVREYTTGLPPTTIYAATEGSGVYRSLTNGVTWETFNSGLDAVPGALNVRTVYTSGLTAYAGTTRRALQVGRRRRLDAGRAGRGGRSEEPEEAQRRRAGALQPAGGPMLAGVASGGVYSSADDGATWTPPAPDNGMARSETVWSFGELHPRRDLRRHRQRHLPLDRTAGSTWTLSSDGISGTTLRVFADGQNPNIYYASGHGNGVYRTINAGHHVVGGRRPARPHARQRRRARAAAVLRRQPDAPVRRHRRRHVRGHARTTARCPAR